ncbi:MAG TPA: hypothetical protein VHG91_16745, partial [Longimicrobium sp.]|nr:hypothetical protein [Longimicrobium sp.]
AREDQMAQEGLFTHHLLEVWAEGAFPGTFCDLYREVRDRVMAERGARAAARATPFADPESSALVRWTESSP